MLKNITVHVFVELYVEKDVGRDGSRIQARRPLLYSHLHTISVAHLRYKLCQWSRLAGVGLHATIYTQLEVAVACLQCSLSYTLHAVCKR